MTIHRHPRLMPSRTRRDEENRSDFKLPDFEIRPFETMIPQLDLRELVDQLPNEGDD